MLYVLLPIVLRPGIWYNMIVKQPHWREKCHIGHEKLKEKDAAEKVGGRALNRAKEALMNKMTKLFMLAAMAAASVVACAADSSKGFSIKTFYKPDHSPVGVGLASVTVSEADIAAAAVKIPCAVYFSEQANDSIGFVFGVSVVSLNGNAGSVSLAVHDPASAYYDSDWSGTTAAGVDFSTKFYMPFTGVKRNNNKLGDFFRYIGKYDSRVEPSQPSAGATNSYLGFWWHRGGDAYTWLGERSDSGPVVVFDVILGKDTPPGTYNVKFAQYNTDLAGEYDIPSPRVARRTLRRLAVLLFPDSRLPLRGLRRFRCRRSTATRTATGRSISRTRYLSARRSATGRNTAGTARTPATSPRRGRPMPTSTNAGMG